MNNNPTSYPAVNELLSAVFSRAKTILDDQLIGMYLHGSLAHGGFDDASDIDVIFATKDELSEEIHQALQNMHTALAQIDSPWAVQVETAYIPIDFLRRSKHVNIRYLHLDRGQGELLHWMEAESDWNIYRYTLRERGIVITGPDPKTFIVPVSAEDLRRAVAEGVPRWFTPLLEDPAEMKMRGLQSFYVLSICRMMYTLKEGEILPKQAAAEWAQQNLDPHWKTLITRALLGRREPNQDSDPEDIRETQELMRFMIGQVKPTIYPDVNEVLNMLLVNVKRILGDQFVGMYLYGSLSSGDFDPKTSDIDFLVVTRENLPEETVVELETMHKQAWATSSKRAGELEGSYIPQDLIRRHDPEGAPCPTVNEGKFFMDRRGSDWIIQRHVVRECGVIVEGPDPKTLIDFVSPDDIRGAVLGILHEWWFPMLDDPSWLRDHGNKYHAFAVITMCRVLHALEHGAVVSKPRAIAWARQHLGVPWTQLIDTAVAAARFETQDNFLDSTLSFIRFVKERTLRVEQPNA